MTKRITALLLTAIIVFGCLCISVNAEEITDPKLSFTKTSTISITDNYVYSGDGALSSFGVEVSLNNKNVVPLDGATTESNIKITHMQARRDDLGVLVYDPENVEPFLEFLQFAEGVETGTIGLTVTVQIDYKYAEVFGEADYTITVNGFSTPPNLGMLGGMLGDSVAVPTAIEQTNKITEFPHIANMEIINSSTKMFYTDSEKPELDGVKLGIETTTGKTGTVTYAPANDHMFTTIPAKTENLTVDTKEIVTYFFGQTLTTLPITVEHDWSEHPVSITTDKYTDAKPGYHAIVCNGCSETHTANPHVIDPNAWVSNEDSTFVKNGTASQPCQVCGATLTKDVLGSADYNDSFANYHFLRVIFDYINLIFRVIGGSLIG